MSSSGRIEDEVAYEKSLAWLVEKAKLLDDPLTLTEEERTKLQRTYDFVAQRIRQYNCGQMVLEDPTRKAFFEKLGVPFQKFESKEGE